jgi:hypothetical protein
MFCCAAGRPHEGRRGGHQGPAGRHGCRGSGTAFNISGYLKFVNNFFHNAGEDAIFTAIRLLCRTPIAASEWRMFLCHFDTVFVTFTASRWSCFGEDQPVFLVV